MNMLGEKSSFEFGWWKNYYNEVGLDGFLKSRENDYSRVIKNFPEINHEQGTGLDMGNGPISVFQFSDKSIVAIDPLNDEYKKIIYRENKNIKYITNNGIPFAEGFFDYILCMNVIDHTPEPDEVIKEMYRTLKKEGTLYFMVNFDDSLSHIHYKLWNDDAVKNLGDFVRHSHKKERIEEHKQYNYWGIYKK